MVESKGYGIWRRSGANGCGLRLLLGTRSPIVAVLQLYSLAGFCRYGGSRIDAGRNTCTIAALFFAGARPWLYERYDVLDALLLTSDVAVILKLVEQATSVRVV